MSAKALMRYVSARIELAERKEIYRVHVTEHLRLLAGTKVSYSEIVGFSETYRDFDARQVADDVISKAGLEVVEE